MLCPGRARARSLPLIYALIRFPDAPPASFRASSFFLPPLAAPTCTRARASMYGANFVSLSRGRRLRRRKRKGIRHTAVWELFYFQLWTSAESQARFFLSLFFFFSRGLVSPFRGARGEEKNGRYKVVGQGRLEQTPLWPKAILYIVWSVHVCVTCRARRYIYMAARGNGNLFALMKYGILVFF